MSDIIDQIAKFLHLQNLDNNPNFSFVERQAGVKPSAIIIAVFVFLLIVTLISNATSIVIAVGCCCVPAYFTFLVIQAQDWNGIKKYLVYWIVYAILQVFAPLLAAIFSSILYIILRVGITVAFIHPQSSIGIRFYDSYIKPFLEKYEQQIDEDIQKIIQKGKQVAKKGQKMIEKQIKKHD